MTDNSRQYLQKATSKMANLQELLNKPADKVERPLPIPGGEYVLSVKSRQAVVSSQKKTDGIEFTFGIEYPHESVDKEALERSKNWRTKELKDTFYLTENSLWRLCGDQTKNPPTDGFFQFLGIDVTGKTILECLPEVIGRTVMATVTQEVNREGTGSFNKISKYQRV